MTHRMLRGRGSAVGLCLSLMLGACETPKPTGAPPTPHPTAIETSPEPEPQVAEGPPTLFRSKPPIPTAQEEEPAGYTVADSSVWYARKLLALFPDAIPIHGVTYAATELPCVPTDLAGFSADASTTDIGLGPAFAVRGSVSLRSLPPPFHVVDGPMGKGYMLHLQAYLIAPSGRVVWSQKGYPQGGAWVNAEGAQANFFLIDAYSGPTAGHTVLIVAAGGPVLSDLSETLVLLGADEIKVQSKPNSQPPKPERVRSISLSDPVLVDFAYKLAVIDNGYLPKGSSQELAIRRQIRDMYPKVRESVEQIADMTVVGVQELETKGIESSNYEILRAVNLSMPPETRQLWPMRYAEIVAAIVVLTGG